MNYPLGVLGQKRSFHFFTSTAQSQPILSTQALYLSDWNFKSLAKVGRLNTRRLSEDLGGWRDFSAVITLRDGTLLQTSTEACFWPWSGLATPWDEESTWQWRHAHLETHFHASGTWGPVTPCWSDLKTTLPKGPFLYRGHTASVLILGPRDGLGSLFCPGCSGTYGRMD